MKSARLSRKGKTRSSIARSRAFGAAGEPIPVTQNNCGSMLALAPATASDNASRAESEGVPVIGFGIQIVRRTMALNICHPPMSGGSPRSPSIKAAAFKATFRKALAYSAMILGRSCLNHGTK